MLGFFFQAYNYTNESQDKTIAINIARNIVNYIENQNFRAMDAYLKIEKTENSRLYAELNWKDCEKKINISLNNSYSPFICGETDTNCTSLFYEGKLAAGSVCTTVLSPTINNEKYTENDISIYLTDYHSDKNIANSLKEQSAEEAFDKLEQSSEDKKIQDKLIKVYVVVNWHDKREKIVLEGVISDESLR